MQMVHDSQVPATSRRSSGTWTRRATLVVAATLVAWLTVVVPLPSASAEGSSEGTFFPLPPSRILDTRTGNGAAVGPVGPNQVMSFTVTDREGVPATDVSAVVLNMTAVFPTAASYLTVWPTGEPMPTASNLNFVPNQVVPNLVKTKVGVAGQVSVYNAAGSVHVLADVAGWYKGGVDPVEGARYQPLTPSRILDTRFGVGAAATTVGPGQSVDLQVTGEGGVPVTGVSAVTMNVTVVGPSAPSSFLTVWPTGEARPTASNLNYVAGDVVANLVLVKVGAGGKVSLYNETGQTHLLADVVGWYSAPGGPGSVYEPLTPSRLLDTRFGKGAPAATVGPGQTVDLKVTGVGGVPLSGVSAVALNVTAVGPSAPSFLTAWPAGEARPTASNLNYKTGQVVPNLVVVKVGAGGGVSLFNDAGQTHLLADVVGWFGVTPGENHRLLSVTVEHPHLFIPDTISAPAASQVTVTFENPTDESHTFTSPPIGVDRPVDAGQSITFTFTMPSTETPFVCLIHQGEGMIGTLIPT